MEVSIKLLMVEKGDRLDEYLIGEDELKYTQTLIIKNKKYFVIDFNQMSKKPLKKNCILSKCKKIISV